MIIHKPLPSVTYLMECFSLRPDVPSGLVWKRRPRSHFSDDRGYIATSYVGHMAGRNAGRGYYQVCIDYETYSSHRIVWAIANRRDPGRSQIDHIDGNKRNNHAGNLRLATATENARSISKSTRNTSGHIGLWLRSSGNWQSRIEMNGKKTSLGSYSRKEDAVKARQIAEIYYYGNFAPCLRNGPPPDFPTHFLAMSANDFVAALQAFVGGVVKAKRARCSELSTAAQFCEPANLVREAADQ